MKIVFERSEYHLDSLSEFLTAYPTAAKLVSFIDDWNQNADIFQFQTSGSTGNPKTIHVTREQILASVSATSKYLGLEKSEAALLCLDPNFVASLMMAARCLVNDIDLVVSRPSANPLSTLEDEVDFASFVPMQIYKMIEEENINELAKIKNILIGGAPLSAAAFEVLSKIDTNIFATYGMTETVSHIALMPIKGPFASAYFEVLPGVHIGQDADGCLNIAGAVTKQETLQTNDIIEMIGPSKFRWLGRRDHVINSGGIKIHPEQLEKVIEPILKTPFFISWKANEKLGSECLLISEGAEVSSEVWLRVKSEIERSFTKYHIPKSILAVDQFERTDSGKIKREATRKKALGLL